MYWRSTLALSPFLPCGYQASQSKQYCYAHIEVLPPGSSDHIEILLKRKEKGSGTGVNFVDLKLKAGKPLLKKQPNQAESIFRNVPAICKRSDQDAGDPRVAKAVPHPNIIKLQEVLYDPPTWKLCMVFELNVYELIQGCHNHLTEDQIKGMMYQLVKAMDLMHRNGIFHRDVKPENTLITGDILKVSPAKRKKLNIMLHA